MHIYLSLRTCGGLEIQQHYNHIIQGVIYDSIDHELATFLHEKGYENENRKFKLFTFSRLLGRFQLNREKSTIRFIDNLQLMISSPVDYFCQSIANGMLTRSNICLGNGNTEVEKMMVQQFKVEKEKIIVRTLSPIVVYSTLLRPDGRKYTCYFQPGEPDYDFLIENNLRKKYKAFYGQKAPAGEVKVKKLGRIKLNVVYYKNTVIKGYSGKLELTGPKELLQMAVDAGLGSKNSQGFGCVELVKR